MTQIDTMCAPSWKMMNIVHASGLSYKRRKIEHFDILFQFISYNGIFKSSKRHDWEKQVLKKILVVLGPENTRVQRFYPILDRHVQMAGLLIKIQLLSYMSKKRMLIGIFFHTLRTLKIYHS